MLVESLSGVRGWYGRDLTPSVAQRYAAAYAFSLMKAAKGKRLRIVIGMDTRPSGPALKDAMLPFLPADVIDVGVLPAPAIEHAVRHFRADGGIIITASHNEPHDNGLKFLRRTGAILEEQEMGKLIALAGRMDAARMKVVLSKGAKALGQRTVREARKEAIGAYRDFVFFIIGDSAGKIRKEKMTVVLDANGGAGSMANHILAQAGIRVVALNSGHGDFAHAVEPTMETLAYLPPLIRKRKAQFGAGFDCDADRVEIILGNGRMLSGNELIALAARHMLSTSSRPEKEVVVVNDATSGMVGEVVRPYGALLKEVPVGESNVVREMKASGSRVGGEGSSSGIIIAPQTCRDGILGILTICGIVADRKKSLEELLDELPRRAYLKRKVSVSKASMAGLRRSITAHYRERGLDVLAEKEGSIKVLMPGSAFAWFRASKTEAGVLRVIVDSPDGEKAEGLMREALALAGGA